MHRSRVTYNRIVLIFIGRGQFLIASSTRRNARRDKSAFALAGTVDLETDKKKLLTRGGTDRNDRSTRLARYMHHRHSSADLPAYHQIHV